MEFKSFFIQKTGRAGEAVLKKLNPMEYVKVHELRELIFAEIDPTIERHRESDENYFWLEYNPAATEKEIEDFIRSIPYFTQGLKGFILNEFFGVQEMLVTEEWKKEFMQKVNIWARSHEWLKGGDSFIRDPYSSSITITIEQLGIGKIQTQSKNSKQTDVSLID